MAQVQAEGDAVCRSQVAVAQHLVAGEADGVFGLLVDAQGTGPQVDVGESHQLGDLRVAGIVEVDVDGGAMGVLVRGTAVVDRRSVFRSLAEEGVHRIVDAVHAQVGGHTVGDLVPLAVSVRGIREDVDESRSHHQAGGVQRRGTHQRIQADPADGVPVDADVGHGVEAGFRIYDPSAGHHDVVNPVVRGHHGLVEGRLDVRHARRRGRRHSGGTRDGRHGGWARCARVARVSRKAPQEGDRRRAEAHAQDEPSPRHGRRPEVVIQAARHRAVGRVVGTLGRIVHRGGR